ncbi:hypothetical protein Bbelb_256770 [Branchiostoma belcheri]|nr:hypothetical protein Bbelb_256770 [Branchiostoma belcheri]
MAAFPVECNRWCHLSTRGEECSNSATFSPDDPAMSHILRKMNDLRRPVWLQLSGRRVYDRQVQLAACRPLFIEVTMEEQQQHNTHGLKEHLKRGEHTYLANKADEGKEFDSKIEQTRHKKRALIVHTTTVSFSGCIGSNK